MDQVLQHESTSNFVGTLVSMALKFGGVFAGVASLALGLLYVKQESLLYFPEIGGIPRRPRSNPRRYRSPKEYGIAFESFMIPTTDGASIHCWLLQQQDGSKPTILFFHGNAGNIGLRLPNANQMYHQLGVNVALIEYRGFGDSSDHQPNEDGLKLDAEAALEFIQAKLPQSKMYIFGRSLGGAVGFHLAQYAERKGIFLAGLMVENTFLSIGKMVDILMPFLAPFKPLVLRMHWDSEKIAKTLHTPILYLSGSSDELVPHSHMKALFRISKQSSALARMHIIKHGKHNESWLQGGQSYWDQMGAFIRDTRDFNWSRIGSNNHSTTQSRTFKSMETESTTALTCDDGTDRDSMAPISSSTHSTTTSSVAVGMGGSVDKVDSDTRLSSIPIMPGNLMGIAREVSAAAISQQQKKTKES